jgi:hypothetical protein
VAAAGRQARRGQQRFQQEESPLERTTPPFAVQAANVLDRLGQAVRPGLPALKSALENVRKPPAKADAFPVRILAHIIEVLEGREASLVCWFIRMLDASASESASEVSYCRRSS